MPKYLFKRWHGFHIIYMMALLVLMTMLMFFYQIYIGILFLILSTISLFFVMISEKRFRKDVQSYIEAIGYRVKRTSNEMVQIMPIGIILFNEEKKIEWHNPIVLKAFNMESAIGEEITEIIPEIKNKKEKEEKFEISIHHRKYEVLLKNEERCIYITDITEYKNLLDKYLEEKPCVGILMFDNIDEATKGKDDQSKNMILAKVSGSITEWGSKNQLYLKRISSDKYLILCEYKSLRQLEQTRFEILDEIKELTNENKVPLTLSMGFATLFGSWIELGQMAQMSLDMSLGRGGDQVTVKIDQKLSFYGGKTNATEKRTRVRARVIAHALRDLIKQSDYVFIMPHVLPDMDALGAAVGLWKATRFIGKEAYIVIEGINPSIEKIMELLNTEPEIQNSIIYPERALELISQQSLIIVEDTHKSSIVVEPRLLEETNQIVIIDHHRRSEDFIQDATLLYIEPYASSTCELVTEILQYMDEKMELSVIESTALLAGIIVDTKSFSMRTGTRTFEAASYLRRSGADAATIQEMLKENLESYIEKAEIIKQTKMLYKHIALVVAKPNQKYSQLAIAQVADTLLNMNDVKASFVISKRKDNMISISARSLGQINVQTIMEKLGGGGHLTNAATQLQCSLEEATQKLTQVLQEIEEQEGLFQ
jgi:c-di-AMP phosphodiesterase-like protein